MKNKQRRALPDPERTGGSAERSAEPAGAALMTELAAHFRRNRGQLREEWSRRIGEGHLLAAITHEEMFIETTAMYDNYVAVLEAGSPEAFREYAKDLSERLIPRGVETQSVLGIVLVLRDVLARFLFDKYQDNIDALYRMLDAYEPAANRIANSVAASFVEERERIIGEQRRAIRDLSAPVLPVRERLLVLPVIGSIDAQRARQLTEHLLHGIRANRAKVVVIDVSGVPPIDPAVAKHLVQGVDAARLMGSIVIVCGLSTEIAQTLVTIGAELTKIKAVADLQSGMEAAERILGYSLVQSACAR